MRAPAVAALLGTLLIPGAARTQPTPPAPRASHLLGAPPFVERVWRTTDGLPHDMVWAVRQTRDGYLWLGTEGGLARFDGVAFVTLGPDEAPGLAGRAVHVLHEDRTGALWVGTEGAGLFRVRGGRIDRPRGVTGRAIGAIVADRRGIVWVGSEQGLVGLDARDSVVARVGVDRLGASRVSALAEHPSGGVWVGTWAGGLYLLRDGRTTRHDVASGLGSSSVRALAVDRDGAVWVATWGGGVRRIGRDGRVAVFPLATRDAGNARDVLVDGDGSVWIGTWGGLLRLPMGAPPGTPPELVTDGRRVAAVALDREGDLWLATAVDGVVRLRRDVVDLVDARHGLASTNVRAVLEAPDSTLWIATKGGGLHRLRAGRVARFTTRDGLLSDDVFALHHDADGVLWVGTAGALHRLDGERIAAVRVPDGDGTIVNAIHRDGAGVLWIGTSGAGLLRYERGALRHVADARLASSTVRSIAHTPDGVVWVGTEDGGLFRHRAGVFAQVPLGPSSVGVRGLHVDAHGALWIATSGDGLARVAGDARATFGIADGMAENQVLGVVEDEAGWIWMSANTGLFRARRRDFEAALRGERIRSEWFGGRREYNGSSQPAAWRTRDGRLLFASMSGLVVVDPRRAPAGQPAPPVRVERVVADGRSLPSDGAGVALAAAERDFRIDYTALALAEPEQVRFRYRLVGYDRAWNDAGTRRTAFYTGVPPGRFTFEVEALHARGAWSPVRATMRLSIAPHVHETRWFAALAALAAVLAVAAAMRWRVARLRARTRELAAVVERRTRELRDRERQLAAQNEQLAVQADALRELDHAKSRFFANVSHEFRTPLTLTVGPLEDLLARFEAGREVADEAPRQLGLALRSARRLLRLVNQILDVAKLESGQMRLRARPLDLAASVCAIAAAFRPMKDRKGIAFDVAVPDSAVTGWVDPDALEKIVTNLLSNAFKYTPDGGRVVLEVERRGPAGDDGGEAVLRVRDTGPGIPAEALPHVFERFRQADESLVRTQPGTGIGLSLTRELVELHGGRIEAASAPGAGATFTVVLPLGCRHLRDDQLASGYDGAAVAGAELVASPGAETALATAESAGEPWRSGGERAHDGVDVPTLLVVDDSADLRAYVGSRFAARYRVVEAADGAEGLELARQVVPDIIVSDVMMPGMDGLEMLRALRADPETDFLSVVLLTARSSVVDRIAGLERGADDYLAKPFEMRELEARVENLRAMRRRLRVRFSGVAERAAARPGAAEPGVAEPSQASPADRALVGRIRAALDANLADEEFGVAELARAVHADRTNLFRKTRELLGLAPSELLRRARLERAAALLASGEGTVADVAYGVGFRSVSHFSQCFRVEYGATPAEFRARRGGASRNVGDSILQHRR